MHLARGSGVWCGCGCVCVWMMQDDRLRLSAIVERMHQSAHCQEIAASSEPMKLRSSVYMFLVDMRLRKCQSSYCRRSMVHASRSMSRNGAEMDPPSSRCRFPSGEVKESLAAEQSETWSPLMYNVRCSASTAFHASIIHRLGRIAGWGSSSA